MKFLLRTLMITTFFMLAVKTGIVNAEPGVPATDPSEITNEQMVDLYKSGDFKKKVKLFDSRPEKKFNSGHIPNAVNLPLDILKKDPTQMEKLAPSKSTKAIFYCAGRECTLSIDSAAIFKKAGYVDVLIYREGIPGWNKKSQPLIAETAFLKKGNVIILDIDSKKKTLVTDKNKTIQMKSKELSSDQGKKLLGELSKNTPIVVLSRGNMTKVNTTLEELRFMDFRRLSYFDLSSWKESLSKATKVSEPLKWAPIYEPGQISPKAFEEAVSTSQYILDVRPEADFAKGHFKGAINLPIEKFETDYKSIPQDKKIFINCATGAKSQKAYDILTRKGYTNLSYLDAEISCKDTDCKIKE